MAHILIVEDDESIHELIKKSLELVGHRCSSAFDGITALQMIEEQDAYDLIMLDVMMPGLDGFELAQQLKHKSDEKLPIIFLTARSAVQDRIKGLNLGADDYITKPFDLVEMQARVEAVLRRTKSADETFVLGDVQVDIAGRLVYKGNSIIDFTPQEFLLIEALVKNKNIALSRERLLDVAWGYDFFGDTRTVDVHIHTIRKKLGWEKTIKTVYKMGYRLEVGRD